MPGELAVSSDRVRLYASNEVSGGCNREMRQEQRVAVSQLPITEFGRNGEGAMQYDLLLTGGEVLDPAAGLHGVMDVGIAGGKIVAVAPSLPANQTRRTISATRAAPGRRTSRVCARSWIATCARV